MGTKLDEKWFHEIVDNVEALGREIRRLEGENNRLDSLLREACRVMNREAIKTIGIEAWLEPEKP